MRTVSRPIHALLLILAVCGPAFAVEPDEILANPKLEARAREISAGLRCLVCQNQSIDDSDAPLARDLRLLVRERLKTGDSDAAVIDFVVARYGEFVLLKPRFSPHTYLLWLAPPFILLLALAAIYAGYRRRAAEPDPAATQELTPSEKERLKKLLDRA